MFAKETISLAILFPSADVINLQPAGSGEDNNIIEIAPILVVFKVELTKLQVDLEPKLPVHE